MHPAVVSLMLFTASVLLHGASGDPRAIPQVLTKNMEISKRQQAIANEKQRCVVDKVDAAFEGNNSRFVSDCKEALIGEFEITALELANDDSSHFQSLINTVYESFCKPDCGNVILNAYSDCGVFDHDLPVSGIEEFTIGLCGTNRHGDYCYEMVTVGMDLIFTEATCYSTAVSTETCTCSSELAEVVKEQDCCINLYHELISGVQGSTYNPPDLYYLCNVELPIGCNNTPLTLPMDQDSIDSTPIHFLSIMTLISVFIFSTVLA